MIDLEDFDKLKKATELIILDGIELAPVLGDLSDRSEKFKAAMTILTDLLTENSGTPNAKFNIP